MVCIICFDTEAANSVVKSASCGCDAEMCLACVDAYVLNHVRGEYGSGAGGAKVASCDEIPCPECKGPWRYAEVSNRVSATTLAMLDASIARTVLGIAAVSCPSCNVISFRAPSTTTATTTAGAAGVQEPVPCDGERCSACPRQIGRGKESIKQWASSKLWKLARTNACPNCNSRIEKNGGCMHMTCAKCRHEFCWRCTGNWRSHNIAWCGYRQAMPFVIFILASLAILFAIYGWRPILAIRDAAYWVGGMIESFFNMVPMSTIRWLLWWPVYAVLNIGIFGVPLAPAVRMASVFFNRRWSAIPGGYPRFAPGKPGRLPPPLSLRAKYALKHLVATGVMSTMVWGIYHYHPEMLTGSFSAVSTLISTLLVLPVMGAVIGFTCVQIVVPLAHMARREAVPTCRRLIRSVQAQMNHCRSWLANEEEDTKWVSVWDARKTSSVH